MPDVAFTCSCKCLFSRYMRDGEAWAAKCPLCGSQVTDAIGPQMSLRQSHLRLPGDQYDYISPIDGAHISSKRAHRDHLKRHRVFEVGNEKPDLSPKQPTIPRESIHAEMRNNVERMKAHGSWRER